MTWCTKPVASTKKRSQLIGFDKTLNMPKQEGGDENSAADGQVVDTPRATTTASRVTKSAEKRAAEENEWQIQCIAGALTNSRGAFPENISYEINGDILTWIARGYECEFKIDCTNALEVVDGFYRAEYFLDTSKVLDDHGELHAVFTVEKDEPVYKPQLIVAQQRIVATVRQMKRKIVMREKLEKEELERKEAQEQLAGDNTKQNGKNGQNGKKRKIKEPQQTRCDPTICVRVLNNQRKVCAKTMNELLSKKDERGILSNCNDTNSQNNFPDLSPTAVIKREFRLLDGETSPVKRRRMSKEAEAAAKFNAMVLPMADEQEQLETTHLKKEDNEGEIPKKNNVFQDCFVPIAKNDWVTESLNRTHKIAY
ncbi:uncharacterized protein BXIN_2760 [Babesia sp. Xinjiang]|uniref:uncharacterized protein n=1 Tax=Babesia sp. Xinjiang TaxID=462227 RepID=UPI000A242732|nr:uncharacterized protein BXIN_2760 [Babesia sp. Xinjiang]ORM41733.1 hypothetical protein BXIN_2760 [Babesia sp. Xinjiang]